MASQLTKEEIESIKQARLLTDQIDKLQARIDDILNPIASKVASLDEETIADAISIMPRGFYRTELRTLLNKNRTLE